MKPLIELAEEHAIAKYGDRSPTARAAYACILLRRAAAELHDEVKRLEEEERGARLLLALREFVEGRDRA